MEVNALKKAIDEEDWEAETKNPHCAANLIKQWFRDLGEPLIPSNF